MLHGGQVSDSIPQPKQQCDLPTHGTDLPLTRLQALAVTLHLLPTLNNAPAAPRLTIGLGLCGLIAAGWLAVGKWQLPGGLELSSASQLATLLFAIGLLMSVAETWCLKPWRLRQSSSPSPKTGSVDPRHVALCRWLGLHVVLTALGIIYWTFPEYRRPLYAPYFSVMSWLVPVISALSLPYLLVHSKWCGPRLDALAELGSLLLRGSRLRSVEPWGQFCLGWLVKGFFLPLMFCYAHQNLVFFQGLLSGSTTFEQVPFARWVQWVVSALFLLDLCWACIGYAWALRLTESHIRSTDSSALSWGVTLICYEPWAQVIGAAYLSTSDAHRWTEWWPAGHLMHYLWGSTIVLLIAVYTASTIAFGLRFSNLTHRGIVAWGPYRYFRHPAYLSKNLSWWLISVPFLAGDTASDSVRACLMLLGLNIVYGLRARAEEEHLSKDPTYVEYAAAVQRRQRQFLARLRLPFNRRPDRTPH